MKFHDSVSFIRAEKWSSCAECESRFGDPNTAGAHESHCHGPPLASPGHHQRWQGTSVDLNERRDQDETLGICHSQRNFCLIL